MISSREKGLQQTNFLLHSFLRLEFVRRIAVDENSTERLDAPLGVTGYQIDMKKSSAGDNEWESLTAAMSNGSLDLEGIDISFSESWEESRQIA